jgi:hypothetical protein
MKFGICGPPCYIDLDIVPFIKRIPSNPNNCLEIYRFSDGSINVIDVNKIDNTSNEHLINLSKVSKLPLSTIFNLPKINLERLLADVYFPGCFVYFKTLEDGRRDPLEFKVYKRLDLEPYENIEITGGLLGRTFGKHEQSLMGHILDESIEISQNGNLVTKDCVFWFHPRFDYEDHGSFVFINELRLETILPKIKKPTFLEWILNIGKPRKTAATYFKIKGPGVYIVRTKLEAYSYCEINY